MRTSFDLPDDLYRTLKAQAARSGLKVRELLIRYLEQGLRGPSPLPPKRAEPRPPPPLMIPSSGHVIRAISRAKLAQIEEDEVRARRG